MRRTCLEMIHELAKCDERVVFIGSDLGAGTLEAMRKEIPERYFMEGVAEANLVGMAAGMAMEGFVPYVNTIATFLTRRCFEQVAIDVCLHDLPVRLVGNGGGLVYAPLGPTHIAIDDLGLMRTLPNMTVIAPADADEMRRFMLAAANWPGPVYIRLGKGGDPIVSRDRDGFEIGSSILLREPGEILIVACGIMVDRALRTADLLAESNVSAGVLNMHTLKPLDEGRLRELAEGVELIVTLDEHLLIGGLGSAVVDALIGSAVMRMPRIFRLGIPDTFTHGYGSQDTMLEGLGLQPPQIAESIRTMLIGESVN